MIFRFPAQHPLVVSWASPSSSRSPHISTEQWMNANSIKITRRWPPLLPKKWASHHHHPFFLHSYEWNVCLPASSLPFEFHRGLGRVVWVIIRTRERLVCLWLLRKLQRLSLYVCLFVWMCAPHMENDYDYIIRIQWRWIWMGKGCGWGWESSPPFAIAEENWILRKITRIKNKPCVCVCQGGLIHFYGM